MGGAGAVSYDSVELIVEGGRGGDGCASLHREKYVPKGGPSGGDGGKGGDIVLRASVDVHGFYDLRGRKSLRAPNGRPGTSNNCHGRDGEELEILVPIGTEVRDAKTDLLLKDLLEDDQTVRIVHGGKGGRGNARFARADRQTPRYAEKGKEGTQRRLRLSLKLLADVGLVGLPNAGKSTLLSRLSRSRTRVGSHRFTTLAPHLGVVELSPAYCLTFADLPGLIEGAHEGRGLGDRFLKHVERCRVLVHVVAHDPTGASPPVDEAYRAVRAELSLYDPSLAEKLEIVAMSKCDMPGWEDALNSLAQVADQEVTPISAVSGMGLNALVARVTRAFDIGEDDPELW